MRALLCAVLACAAGAGMQGDRSSIVFASPKEISSFILWSCQ